MGLAGRRTLWVGFRIYFSFSTLRLARSISLGIGGIIKSNGADPQPLLIPGGLIHYKL